MRTRTRTGMIKKGLAALLTTWMLLALAACSGGPTAAETWITETTAAMSQATAAQKSLAKALAAVEANLTDAGALTTLDGAIDASTAAFETLSKLEAPEEYRDVQELIQTAADQARESLAKYREAGQALAGAEPDQGLAEARISEGQSGWAGFQDLWLDVMNRFKEISGYQETDD